MLCSTGGGLYGPRGLLLERLRGWRVRLSSVLSLVGASIMQRRWTVGTLALAMLACVPASHEPENDAGAVAMHDAFVARRDAYVDRDGAACAPLDAPCRLDVDCCSNACSLDGVCHAPPAHPCNADSDCTAGQICQTCNQTCIFPPGGACDLSAPCPCDYYCSSSLCLAIGDTPPAMCVSGTDCPINRFCNRAVFQCQVPMIVAIGSSASCTANADCSVGEMCSDTDGTRKCVGVGVTPCRTDADCGDPQNPSCAENQCFPRRAC
jgi:hypothetical protein